MAKQLKEIEIPFGAYDSELDGFEYTIPEGYKAEIKDGKVVVRKTESEDERIRKEMIFYFQEEIPQCSIQEHADKMKEFIAWLEKQGGHSKFINGIQVGDKVTRNEDGVLVNLSQLNRVAKKDEKQGKQKDILEDAILDSNKDGLIADTIRYKREKQGEQKPAKTEKGTNGNEREIPNSAWSDGDIVAIDCAVDVLSKDLPSLAASIERLKSLRPKTTWKPSDEQMEALLKLEEMHVLEHEKNQENAHLYMVVKSIREQLLKLREEQLC